MAPDVYPIISHFIVLHFKHSTYIFLPQIITIIIIIIIISIKKKNK